MRIFLIFFLTFLNLTFFGQKPKQDFAYSIVFASCFQNDFVGLKVNDTTLISSQKVSSDPITGITQLSAYQDKRAVWVVDETDKKRFVLMTVGNNISIDVMLNGSSTKFYINLKDGKIIFIDNCFVQELGKRKQKVTIKQFKETVLLF
ncbi:MAG TPA: hypothetical protein VIQ00_04960 [Chitinophagaceae bacterium]|jgi:hypothetical protein